MLDDFSARPGAALVLGASGGIGAAIARLLVERGSDVALTFRRDSPRVESLLALDAAPVRKAYRLDLTDQAACASAVDGVLADFGAIHTLVYAAGPLVPMVHLSRIEPAHMAAQLNADVVAMFNVVSPALAHLRESGGNIVAVTSAVTDRYAPRDGLSAVPKGAVEALARGLAVEEGRYGVRVNCVGPGMLSDGMAEHLIASDDLHPGALDAALVNTPLRRFGTAVDIAEVVCFLASDRAGFISGQKINVDGGYSV